MGDGVDRKSFMFAFLRKKYAFSDQRAPRS
jgi:hypothetical protein